MTAIKVPQNILKWLKEHLLPRGRQDLPPAYEETSGLITIEYRQRARSLVKQHRNRDFWFFGTKGEPLVKDITSFARGKSLSNKTKEYVYEALDEFRLLMEFVDFLVDKSGLKHASGAENCETWYFPGRGGRYTNEGIKEIESLRFWLGREVARGWNVITAVPELPFLYLAACVYETDPVERNRKDILHQIDLLDKRFVLLRDHYNWKGPRDFIISLPGEMSGLEKFRFVIEEARSGDNNFQMTTSKETFKRNYKKSDAFIEELYGV